jgi:hypothetical protein
VVRGPVSPHSPSPAHRTPGCTWCHDHG